MSRGAAAAEAMPEGSPATIPKGSPAMAACLAAEAAVAGEGEEVEVEVGVMDVVWSREERGWGGRGREEEEEEAVERAAERAAEVSASVAAALAGPLASNPHKRGAGAEENPPPSGISQQPTQKRRRCGREPLPSGMSRP